MQSRDEQIADTLESVVKGEKKLPPNVDWPSARLYNYMNLPVSLYTPLFVVARVTGWSAHVMETARDNRLNRPDGIYVGKPSRSFVPDRSQIARGTTVSKRRTRDAIACEPRTLTISPVVHSSGITGSHRARLANESIHSTSRLPFP